MSDAPDPGKAGSRGWIVAVLGVAAAGGLLWWATLSQSRVECEACMRFRGQRVCSTVAAATREQAEHRAITHACSVLSQGVTGGLSCQRTPPESLVCRE